VLRLNNAASFLGWQRALAKRIHKGESVPKFLGLELVLTTIPGVFILRCSSSDPINVRGHSCSNPLMGQESTYSDLESASKSRM
jgi:hypothetical protein